MRYFSIELYALTTGNVKKYVSGVTVNLYNSNGALVTTLTTNTSGRAQYQTNSYTALSFTANRTGYNEMGGTLTSKTNSTTYDSHQLTPNSPQYLPTSNTWYKIDGKKYIGGKSISQGIYLPDGSIKTTPDTSTNLISSGNSGTSIVEFYLHTTQSSGIVYPKLGIYENNSFVTKSNVFDFTNMKVGQDINTSEYDSKRYVVSTHYIYGKNSTNTTGLFVAASNSNSGTNAIAYNYSKNNKNAWTEYKDHGGVNYYSITADENNLKTFTQLSVEKDYIYTFNIHTYSEANYDGVVISNSELPSSISSLHDVNVGSYGVLKTVSGVDKLDTYKYISSSNGTIYIYFITDTGGLGDTVDTSTGSESKRGYTYADVKVEKKIDRYIFTFSSTKRAFVEGDVIDNDTTTTKTYNSSGPVVLPRPYASDGLFYCDVWVERMTRKLFDVGKEYSISDFRGTQFIASQWNNKTKVSIPSGTDKVYSGKDQYWTIIDNNTISVQGTIHATNVGTYSVTLKLIDDVHYVWEDNTLKDKTFTWSITKRSVTITAKSNSKTYDGTAIVPPGGGTGGADVITSSNLVSGHVCYAVLSRTGNGILPGTYAYTPTGIKIHVNNQSGADVTSNYSITPKNGAGTVSKYTPTITLNATDRAYNGSPLYATASVSHPTSGKTIKGTIKYGTSSGATTYSATYSGTSVGLSSVHVLNYNESATVYAYFVPDSTCSDCYNQSGSVSKTFKINAKASSKLPTTWGGDSKTYHNTASPTASGYSGGTLYYRTSSNNSTWGSWTTTKPTRTEVGTTYVQCYVKGDNNHNDSSVSSSVSITINKATDAQMTVSLSSGLTYNGSDQVLAQEGSLHGLSTYYLGYNTSKSTATDSEVTWGSANNSISARNGGTYYIYYKFSPDGNHSNSKSCTYVGSVTIGQKNGYGTVSISNWTYGQTASNPTASGSSTSITYTWYNSNKTQLSSRPTSKSAVGTYYIRATFAANNNYKAYTTDYASFSILDTILSHNPTASIGSGITAGGGSATVTGQCTRTWASGKTDTSGISKVEITTNGNGRFSVSGTKISHSSMGTNVTTDTVVVKVTFADGSIKSDVKTSVSNSLTWSSPVISHTTPISLAVSGQTYTMSPTITQSGSYTSGSSASNTSATYSYAVKTTVSGYSLSSSKVTVSNNNTTSARNGFVVTITATTPSTAGSKSSTKDVVFNQAAGSKVYNNPTITKFVYDTFPANGATKTPSVTYSQVWTWNGVSGSGGTLTSGGTLAYTTTGDLPSGFATATGFATTGSVVWANRTTVVGVARSAKSNLKVAVTMNDLTSATYTCISCDQVANELVELSLSLNPDTIEYGATSVPTTTATYTSGSTKNVSYLATYTSSDNNVAEVKSEWIPGQQ